MKNIVENYFDIMHHTEKMMNKNKEYIKGCYILRLHKKTYLHSVLDKKWEVSIGRTDAVMLHPDNSTDISFRKYDDAVEYFEKMKEELDKRVENDD